MHDEAELISSEHGRLHQNLGIAVHFCLAVINSAENHIAITALNEQFPHEKPSFTRIAQLVESSHATGRLVRVAMIPAWKTMRGWKTMDYLSS